jgi:hypothetical protein
MQLRVLYPRPSPVVLEAAAIFQVLGLLMNIDSIFHKG